MNLVGVLIAVFGIGLSLLIIFSCLIWFIECVLDVWFDRWEWIRKRLIRRMVFRSKGAKLSRTELRNLNRDIDFLNYIFQKYRLDEDYDKEEKQYIRQVKKLNNDFGAHG